MKKTLSYLAFMSAIIFGLISFMQTAATAETIRWRMATAFSPVLTPYHENTINFAKMVNDMSHGRLVITVHPAGELIPPFEVFDATRNGTIQMASAVPTYWTSKNTAFDLLCSMGFMMTPADWMTWLYNGGGLELGQELYAKYNIKFFPMAVTGPESGFRLRTPIRTLDDFKGQKLRTGVLQTIWILQQLGASPVRMPGGEVYMALKLGTIDGAEMGGPSIDWNIKLQETTKYVLTPAGWHQAGTVSDLMINMDAWNKLPKDLQAIVEIAAKASMSWAYAKANWDAIAAVENFKKAGIEESKLDKTAQDKLESLAIQYMEIESAKNPDYAKIAKSMVNYLVGFDTVRDLEGRFASGTSLKIYPNVK
jgi:TRAP-type mannitol/chloroaromatic compound transport system substrate-binding protein